MSQKKFIHHDSTEVQKQAILITLFRLFRNTFVGGYNYKNKHRNE